MMEGTSPMSFFNIPAIIIVVGGTLGVCLASSGMEAMKRTPALYKKAFAGEHEELGTKVVELVRYADRARRDGLLALDEQLSEVEDPFTRKGLQLVVDGTDPELVAEVLDAENMNMRKRHAAAAQPFEKAGGFAPTMGIVGTVFGLVNVLSNLDAPETLGPAISVAFIATLYGVGGANVVFLPVSSRLKALSEEEVELRSLTLDGILAVQAGDNPRVVAEKLIPFVPPAQRPSEDDQSSSGSGAERAAA